MQHLTTLEIYHQVTTGVQISPRKYLLAPGHGDTGPVSALVCAAAGKLRLILASQGHLIEMSLCLVSPVLLCCCIAA